MLIFYPQLNSSCAFCIPNTLPDLLSLRTSPPLSDADESLWTEVDERRQQLFAFYAAGLAAYAGHRDNWARIIAGTAGTDLRNPYYRWLVGSDSAAANPPGGTVTR